MILSPCVGIQGALLSLLFEKYITYDIICIACGNDDPISSTRIVRASICRMNTHSPYVGGKFPKIICYSSKRLALPSYPMFVYMGKRKPSPTSMVWNAGGTCDVLTDGFKQGANCSKNLLKARYLTAMLEI